MRRKNTTENVLNYVTGHSDSKFRIDKRSDVRHCGLRFQPTVEGVCVVMNAEAILVVHTHCQCGEVVALDLCKQHIEIVLVSQHTVDC